MTARSRTGTGARGKVAALLLLTFTSAAEVQAATPGRGIRVGDTGRLDAAITTGFEWQSNPYQTATVTKRGANLMVNPTLAFESVTRPAELNLSAGLTARKFLTSATANLDRASDAGIALSANLLPQAAVGVRIEDDFFNENRPNEALFADRAQGERAFITQLHNELMGFVSVHPGRALTVDVGGHFTFDNYSGFDNSSFSGEAFSNNRYAYGPRLEAEWAFLPKTALVADFGYTWNDWDRQAIVTIDMTPTGEFPDDVLLLPDSQGWKLNTGIIGRFTKKLVLNAVVGYGRLVYSEESVATGITDNQLQFVDGGLNAAAQGWDASVTGVGGLIGTAQLAYTPLKGHKLSLGYIRDFEDSWFTNFVAYHYGFVGYEAAISRQVRAGVDFGYRLESYQGDFNRQDHVLRVNGNVSYRPVDWMTVTGNLGWRRRAASRLDEDNFPVRAQSEFDNLPVSVLFTFAY